MINETFRRYLEEAIGSGNALVAFSAFEKPASVAVRKNPFKGGTCPDGREVAWCRHGRILSERPQFTLDPHFHAGSYYVQDSSSMFVGHAFRRLLETISQPHGRKLRVLDLCAAPGGKTTDLAASLREAFGDDFLLVSNEVMKSRAGVLADNVALWGDPNVIVTSDDPRAFASLPGFFDIIVADVPCSGEGMFRKDEEAQRQWSEDNVALCEARQKRIVADVWPALARDGIFIYSTCTFNRYENDGNVRWIADELGADPLFDEDLLKPGAGVIKTDLGYSLVPGHVEGEGQYCSALRKTSGESATPYANEGIFANGNRKKAVSYANKAVFANGNRKKGGPYAKESVFANGDEISGLFNIDICIKQRGETIIAVPKALSQDVAALEASLHVIAAGCAVGILKGQTLVPDADLALSTVFRRGAFPEAELDLKTALAFLHKDAISLPDAPKGYVTVLYKGIPLGFVKNLGNRCNNLHPQSRRIRMNI